MALGLGLLFGWLGPFGSYPALETGPRYVFWLTLIPLGAALLVMAQAWVGARPRLAAWPAWARLSLATAVSAVPHTLATACAIAVMRPERGLGVPDLPALFVAVGSVQALLALAGMVGARPAEAAVAELEPETDAPGLLARIPARLGPDLIAVTAEDHYVRVHTTLGSALVLMRFTDAVSALPNGLQVNRGWWVARQAITDVRRGGGRTTILLSNGLKAPVSRPFRAAVRARVGR